MAEKSVKKTENDLIRLPQSITLLVVDDDAAVLQVTRLVLSRYRYRGIPLEILEASSAAEAKKLLHNRPDISVLFLDVVMESDHAGLELVEYIRNTLENHYVRIIIRTGQPGYAPEKQVVQDYDINDYLMKSDSTQSRLEVSLTTAVRSYFDILRAEQLSRQVLSSEAARESADFASLQKTRFLAHMSHEIRTPLNGVTGLISLLAETDLSSEQRELVKDLQLSADVLLGLVNDVLDISKIEAGKLELSESRFQARLLLDKVSALFSVTLAKKNIRFIQEYDELGNKEFYADAQRLQQILINYLSNACKFTPENGQITLRAGYRNNDRGEVLFFAEVKDNGSGIRSEKLASIFDPYEQESADISMRYGGTGLGLSLCYALAELMGGEVGVESEVGKGSCFRVSVPLKPCAQVTDGSSAEKVLDENSLAGWNILVAEDDHTSQKVIIRMLSQLGAIVSCFSNGQDLLNHGKVHECDAVLLDCHMPVMDGPECARQLRSKGYSGPLLALTAAVTELERENCLAAGMDEVQPKPLNCQRLVEWLQKNKRP